jgi:hypothetical protein
MIQRDSNAQLTEERRFLGIRGANLSAGGKSQRVSHQQLNEQEKRPVRVMASGDKTHSWWIYKDSVYVNKIMSELDKPISDAAIAAQITDADPRIRLARKEAAEAAEAAAEEAARLREEEIQALAYYREQRERNKMQRIVEAYRSRNAMPASPPGRKPMPEDIKTIVWKRDGGRCVHCGAPSNLEFDHIIPVVLGGADSVANIQLHCLTCNRAKGGNLT